MLTRKIKKTKEIGELVKKRRKELGISQERLAEMLNVTYQQVQRYENGKNRLNVEHIQIIADALSVPITYFFKFDEKQGAEKKVPFLQPEERKLLKHFRKVRNNQSKILVINVARLASKVEKVE
ncbi:MAG: helix-turn-helix transcriptional regulator [Nitrospirales bacterium]|nr:helix-turn-helix transcriptional regulator [Nitrospirales bacterium]